MKVTVPGKTPMERLTNFTKKIIQVHKSEIVDTRGTVKARRPRRVRRK